MAKDEFARTDGAEDETIRRLYEEANRKQVCPFDDLDPDVNRPVYPESDLLHWNVWRRPVLVPGSSVHIMLASKEHLRYFDELPDEGKLEYFRILAKLRSDYGQCHSILSRLGGTPEANYNATTIYHLHAHFIVSDRQPVDMNAMPTQAKTIYALLKGLAPEDENPLDFIDTVRGWIDDARAAEDGKARPIRLKVSNAIERRTGD